MEYRVVCTYSVKITQFTRFYSEKRKKQAINSMVLEFNAKGSVLDIIDLIFENYKEPISCHYSREGIDPKRYVYVRKELQEKIRDYYIDMGDNFFEESKFFSAEKEEFPAKHHVLYNSEMSIKIIEY